MALARTIGLSAGYAERAMVDLTGRVAERAQALRLPAFAADTETARDAQDKVIALVGERCATRAVEGG